MNTPPTTFQNPNNWYWVVDNSTTQVFSSAAKIYVNVSNSDYMAWLGMGFQPTHVSGESNLVAGLSRLGIVVHTKLGLITYVNKKQLAHLTGGLSVDIGGGQMIECYTDPLNLALLLGAVDYVKDHSTVSWIQESGPITLTANNINTIYTAVKAFTQGSFVTLGQVITAINDDTITNQSQVDNPPYPIPAWPV